MVCHVGSVAAPSTRAFRSLCGNTWRGSLLHSQLSRWVSADRWCQGGSTSENLPAEWCRWPDATVLPPRTGDLALASPDLVSEARPSRSATSHWRLV